MGCTTVLDVLEIPGGSSLLPLILNAVRRLGRQPGDICVDGLLRILTLSYEFPPLGGGGSQVVHGLTGELIRLGHEVDVVTMGFGDLPRRENVGGAEVHRIPCIRAKESICHPHEMASYLVAAYPRLRKLAAERKYDLNHTHFIFPDGVLSYLLQRRTGLPYMVTAHGSDIQGYNPNRFKLAHKVLAPAWKRVVDGAMRIVFPSESLRSIFLRHRTGAKTSVIPNGITPDRCRPDRPKEDRILVVTRMFERKGVQYLLRALKGDANGYPVEIVGTGPYLPELKKLASRLSRPVRFHGWLDNDSRELADLYETSRIFVFPSEMENCPIVLLEAMAAGMAIITTEGTGCHELVGDAARLVEPRSSDSIRAALTELTGDPDLCARLGREARERLDRNYTWSAIAGRYVELYQRSEGPGPSGRLAAGSGE